MATPQVSPDIAFKEIASGVLASRARAAQYLLLLDSKNSLVGSNLCGRACPTPTWVGTGFCGFRRGGLSLLFLISVEWGVYLLFAIKYRLHASLKKKKKENAFKQNQVILLSRPESIFRPSLWSDSITSSTGCARERSETKILAPLCPFYWDGVLGDCRDLCLWLCCLCPPFLLPFFLSFFPSSFLPSSFPSFLSFLSYRDPPALASPPSGCAWLFLRCLPIVTQGYTGCSIHPL